ncbi:MAG: hypothetical protein ACHQAQ_05580 [Hyphomicrobiales bacterium]
MPDNAELIRPELDPSRFLPSAGVLSDIAASLVAPLENDDDAYDRIVQLFRMQLLWFFPAKLRLSKPNKFMKERARADEAVILRGRMLAAIEVIERVMPKMRVAGLRQAARTTTLDPFYGKFETLWPIFREHLWPEDPGRRVLFRMAAKKALRRRIRERMPLTSGPAAIVHVLYHARDELAQLFPNSGSLPAAAEVVVSGNGPCKFAKSKSSLRDYWNEMKTVAIIHYLIQYQDFKFAIPIINNTDFIDKMLEMVENTANLRIFFRTHDHVANLLNQRGHNFPILGVVGDDVTPQLKELELTQSTFDCLKTVSEVGTDPF